MTDADGNAGPSDPADLMRKAVIADDHAIVRRGLREVLGGIALVDVVAEAANGLEAIAAGKAHRPDLMTLDAQMPLSDGMEVFGEIRRWSPNTRIVLVTGFTATGFLASWLDAGVDGLLLKSADPTTMHAGFEAVLGGGRFVDPEVTAALQMHQRHDRLTLRERQVLHLIAGGHTNAEIGARLSISPKTAENHRTRLMAKLGVRSAAQLVAYALREGLLDQVSQL